MDHLFEQHRISTLKQYNEKNEKNQKKTSQTNKMNEQGGLTDSDCNNNHQSKPNMKEPQKRKMHSTKIILPKQLKLNLKPLGPTDYNSIPT